MCAGVSVSVCASVHVCVWLPYLGYFKELFVRLSSFPFVLSNSNCEKHAANTFNDSLF